MLEYLVYIWSILWILASLIEILQFFKIIRPKYKVVVFLTILTCTTIWLVTWNIIDKRTESANIEAVKKNLMQSDAKITAEAIIISGWENSWDYLGYLTQITWFYWRYKNIYNLEYEINKQQLEWFIAFFREKRDKNEFTYSNEWDELKWLVESGRDNLIKIADGVK